MSSPLTSSMLVSGLEKLNKLNSLLFFYNLTKVEDFNNKNILPICLKHYWKILMGKLRKKYLMKH